MKGSWLRRAAIWLGIMPAFPAESSERVEKMIADRELRLEVLHGLAANGHIEDRVKVVLGALESIRSPQVIYLPTTMLAIETARLSIEIAKLAEQTEHLRKATDVLRDTMQALAQALKRADQPLKFDEQGRLKVVSVSEPKARHPETTLKTF